jgi:hypothetical protein
LPGIFVAYSAYIHGRARRAALSFFDMIRGFALDVFQHSCCTAVFQTPRLILCFFAYILGSQLLGTHGTTSQDRWMLRVFSESILTSPGIQFHILYSTLLSGFVSFFMPIPLDCVNRDKKANAQNWNKYTRDCSDCQDVYQFFHIPLPHFMFKRPDRCAPFSFGITRGGIPRVSASTILARFVLFVKLGIG